MWYISKIFAGNIFEAIVATELQLIKVTKPWDVPSLWSDSGHWRRYDSRGLPANMTKLRKQSMYPSISGENAVTALLEVLKREEDILEAELIRKESSTRLINLTVSNTYLTFNGNIY
ncbi:unnamed protein product [Protopolystoma xenopodis]|uniref:Uncharacterized protein n=1 Tax=Protopolystoma xenopodis TaxID=117903 RepID=A0A3S5FEB2_9PLAT|nr:unnamed protein product [Protopolystoma xenopodis]